MLNPRLYRLPRPNNGHGLASIKKACWYVGWVEEPKASIGINRKRLQNPTSNRVVVGQVAHVVLTAWEIHDGASMM